MVEGSKVKEEVLVLGDVIDVVKVSSSCGVAVWDVIGEEAMVVVVVDGRETFSMCVKFSQETNKKKSQNQELNF